MANPPDPQPTDEQDRPSDLCAETTELPPYWTHRCDLLADHDGNHHCPICWKDWAVAS